MKYKLYLFYLITISFILRLNLVISSCVYLVDHDDFDEVEYCADLITYPIQQGMNASEADAMARSLYNIDRMVWESESKVSCIEQVYNETTEQLETMCNDCLAIRRRWHCASNFPRCICDDNSCNTTRVQCKHLCETVEERCKMALEGVPVQTRKSFEDGTTIFERVLPA